MQRSHAHFCVALFCVRLYSLKGFTQTEVKAKGHGCSMDSGFYFCNWWVFTLDLILTFDGNQISKRSSLCSCVGSEVSGHVFYLSTCFIFPARFSCSQTSECSYYSLLDYLNLTSSNVALETMRPVKNWTRSTVVQVDLFLLGILESVSILIVLLAWTEQKQKSISSIIP